MWQNIDQFEKENPLDYPDKTALLLHFIGYRGDLDGENETDALLWTGGAPVAKSNCMTM